MADADGAREPRDEPLDLLQRGRQRRVIERRGHSPRECEAAVDEVGGLREPVDGQPVQFDVQAGELVEPPTHRPRFMFHGVEQHAARAHGPSPGSAAAPPRRDRAPRAFAAPDIRCRRATRGTRPRRAPRRWRRAAVSRERRAVAANRPAGWRPSTARSRSRLSKPPVFVPGVPTTATGPSNRCSSQVPRLAATTSALSVIGRAQRTDEEGPRPSDGRSRWARTVDDAFGRAIPWGDDRPRAPDLRRLRERPGARVPFVVGPGGARPDGDRRRARRQVLGRAAARRGSTSRASSST